MILIETDSEFDGVSRLSLTRTELKAVIKKPQTQLKGSSK